MSSKDIPTEARVSHFVKPSIHRQQPLGDGNTRSIWALTDQGVVSAGNFLSTLLLARALPPAEYGGFVLIYGACLVANGLHSNLIISPLVVFSSTASPGKSRVYSTASIFLTLALSLLFSVIVISAAASLHLLIGGILAMVALVAWQVQETLRRSLLAKGRCLDAVWGDSVSYLGQALVFEIMLHLRVVTVHKAFLVIAATSLLAAIIQMVQVGQADCPVSVLRDIASEFWRLSKWLALGGLASVLGPPLIPWLLNWTHGRAAAAEYQAVANVVRLANPLLLSIPALVMPVAARLAAGETSESLVAVRRHTFRYILSFEGFVLPWFLILSVCPAMVLSFFYGSASSYSHSVLPLRLCVVRYGLGIPLAVLVAMLVGRGKGKVTAAVQVSGTIAAILVSFPLVYYAGVPGGIIADIVGCLTMLCICSRSQCFRRTTPPLTKCLARAVLP